MSAEQQRQRRLARLAAGVCPTCGKVPPIEGQRQCGSCRTKSREQSARRRAEGKQLAWQRANQPRLRIYFRALQADRRRQVIEGYGARCVCCGETEYAFLTIDHINGGGGKHRKKVSATMIYQNIIKAGFPPDYQILCWNCHMAKDRSGGCPHQG